MLRCIQYQTKIQFPKQETIPVENYAVLGEQKTLFYIVIHGGAKHFCRLKSHPNLYFETLTITPENFIEIKHHLLQIRSAKVEQCIHGPYGKLSSDPLILFSSPGTKCQVRYCEGVDSGVVHR